MFKKQLFCIMAVIVTVTYGWRQNEMELLIFINTPQEVKEIHSLGLMGDIRQNAGFARVFATPSEVRKIDALGLSYKIITNDLNAFWAEKRKKLHRQGVSYDQILKTINNLAATKPEICKKYIFGKSVQGKEMALLKITDNADKEEYEPEILFDGSTHGDEIGGAYVLNKFAKKLCESYGTDNTLTQLINENEIWCFFMVNPDNLGRSRTNANRVDLNRNYGYKARGFSEPETRAMRDALLANQFAIQITMHSGMVALLYPWCHTGSDTPDEQFFKQLCEVFSSSSGYSRLPNRQSYDDYPTTGETIDFSYGAMGTMSITHELSSSKSQTKNMYEWNEPAFIEMIKYADYGVKGKLLDAVTNQPVTGYVYVDNYFPVYSDPEVGDYHKYCSAGTYTLRVVANGYKEKIVTGVTVPSNGNVETHFQLERETNSKAKYAYRVVNAGKGSGNTHDVLGPPDDKTCSGELTVDMQLVITQGKIKIHGSDNYTVSAAKEIDGPFQSLGSGSEFDLQGSARYIKIRGGAVDAVESAWDLPTPISDNNTSNAPWALPIDLKICQLDNQHVTFAITNRTSYVLQVFDLKGEKQWQVSNHNQSSVPSWRPSHSGLYIIDLTTPQKLLRKTFLVVK